MSAPAYRLGRPERLYVVLAAVFLTALVVAEATALKFFTALALPRPLTILGERFDAVVMTAGVLAFPVTFVVTDLINEYFGKPGIRFVSALGVAMVLFEFAILQAAMAVPTAPNSPVSGAAFDEVFGASARAIAGSLVAYAVGQLVDIALFHRLRRATGGRHLWLRATGSTFGSQFFDTLIVLVVALAGQLSFAAILAITLFNYGYKLLIAAALTPVIYLAHRAIDRYLGRSLSEALTDSAEAQA